MGDIKTYLRKKDFPEVVLEALNQMQKLWLPDCTSQQLTLMKELSQEFVFFEIDQWCRIREQKLNAIKELQVLEKICCYFKESGPEPKLATFIFLFPFGSAMLDKRLPVLNKLVSLAVSLGNSNVLTYIGIWMQLAGCHSRYSLLIAKSVHHERFRPSTYKSDIVKNLPNNSQLFCASLLTSMSSTYPSYCPPKHVAELVLDWVKVKPSFVFSPLNMVIPKIFNFSGPQCPIPELLRWTVLSPLDKVNAEENDALYFNLHLALLECFQDAREYADTVKWEALPAEKIKPVVTVLKRATNIAQDDMSLALERLAQGLDLGLASQCIHPESGKLGDLFVCCVDLPYHQLLKIVLQKWSYEVDAAKSDGN